MNNGDEQQQQQQQLRQPFPSFPIRGRGRGQRGRQRSRAATTTLQQHVDDIVVRQPRRAAQDNKARFEEKRPKEEASSMMLNLFTPSLNTLQPYEQFDLNVLGFQEMVHDCYDTIVTNVPHSAELLSEPEFQLVCGYLLYLRVFSIQKSTLPIDLSMSNLERVMPPDMLIPGPVANYLSNLGTLKNEDGSLFVPQVYLGNTDVNSECTLPVEGVTNVYAINKFTAFFPFSMWSRKILQQTAVAGFALNANWQLMVPGAISANDAFVSRVGCYSTVNNSVNIHPNRARDINADANYRNRFVVNGTLLGRIYFNESLVRQFLKFCVFSSRKYKMEKVRPGSSGSKSQLAYCEPRDGDGNDPPTQYSYFSSITLSKNEMQMAAIFRYRINISENNNSVDQANNNDFSDTVNSSPSIMHAPATMVVNAPNSIVATTFAFCQIFKI